MRRVSRLGVLVALLVPAGLTAGDGTEELLQKAEARIKAEQFEAAESILVEALKHDPAHAQVLYRLGYVHYRQRKLAAARQNFTTVVKSAPPAYFSRYFLGRIALLENNPREAVTWLEPVLEAKQAVFDSASQLASAYAGVGLPEKAIAALRVAIGEAPWDASLYYRLGRLYTERGRKELAQEAFDNSRRLRSANGEDVETLVQVSQLLNENKQAEALESAARIRGRKDADPNALVALGVLYGNRQLQREALDAFERAAARDPAFFQAQYNRGLALLKLNRASEALEPLRRAMDLLPQSSDANETYGLAAVMNQRYADAIHPLERVWRADPSNVRAGALLATSYLRTGAASKAAELLRGDVFRSSSQPALVLLRVEALNAADDPNGALEAAEQARKLAPQLPQTNLALAQQLARVGRYRDAQPAFAEALKLVPGHPEAELGLADTLSRSGEHAQAIQHYQAAAANTRTSVAAKTGLARSLIALRKLDEARQVLEDGVSAHPSEVPLHIELSRVYARLGKPELAAEQTRIVESLRAKRTDP